MIRPVLLFVVPFLFSGLTATGIRACTGWASRSSDDLARLLALLAFIVFFVAAPLAGLALFGSVYGGATPAARAFVLLVWLVPDCLYVGLNWSALRDRLARR